MTYAESTRQAVDVMFESMDDYSQAVFLDRKAFRMYEVESIEDLKAENENLKAEVEKLNEHILDMQIVNESFYREDDGEL